MPLFPPARLRPARCSESLLISDRVAAGDLYSCRSGDSGCWFKRDFGRGSDATCCCRHGWTASRSNASGSCCPIRPAPRPSAGPRSSAPPRASVGPAARLSRPCRVRLSAPPRVRRPHRARPSARCVAAALPRSHGCAAARRLRTALVAAVLQPLNRHRFTLIPPRPHPSRPRRRRPAAPPPRVRLWRRAARRCPPTPLWHPLPLPP